MENEQETPLNEAEVADIFSGLEITEEALETDLDRLAKRHGSPELSTEELCFLLGLSSGRISQLVAAGYIPEPRREGKRNFYKLFHAVQGYIDLLK